MSIYLSIGSSDDILNLQKTVKHLHTLLQLSQSEDHSREIKSLISWYDSLMTILYNGGNLEDYSDKSEYTPV